MTPSSQCLQYVGGKCTAKSCNWRDKRDASVCIQGGKLSRDRLSERVEAVSVKDARKDFVQFR